MINFEINDVKYKFYFSYTRKDENNKNDIVFCHLENCQTKNNIITTFAKCSSEDNFSKEIGRQISFVRCVFEIYYFYPLKFKNVDEHLLKKELIKCVGQYFKNKNLIKEIHLPEKELLKLNILLLHNI